MAARRAGSNRAIYVISVAAELAGVHPQTLRVYERKGLLSPQRTAGNTRRYSERDIDRLRKIQQLTQEGVNLAGVMSIMELEERLAQAQDELGAALDELDRAERSLEELMQARAAMSLVPLREIRRMRRAMRSDRIEEAGRRRVFQAPAISEDATKPTDQ
ncbi:MAG: heat shock protein transcriptional repressor HspR [Actinomycetota bacterium]